MLRLLASAVVLLLLTGCTADQDSDVTVDPTVDASSRTPASTAATANPDPPGTEPAASESTPSDPTPSDPVGSTDSVSIADDAVARRLAAAGYRGVGKRRRRRRSPTSSWMDG